MKDHDRDGAGGVGAPTRSSLPTMPAPVDAAIGAGGGVLDRGLAALRSSHTGANCG